MSLRYKSNVLYCCIFKLMKTAFGTHLIKLFTSLAENLKCNTRDFMMRNYASIDKIG